ncbi:MAG: hypothetical protein HY203_05225 [Nitrospirae bacterium]|nr:hypothetical protein [Nitrospirota bacterium]
MKLLKLKTKDPEQASTLLQEAISNELKLIQTGIDQLQAEIRTFEQKYRQSSKEFFRKYQQGKAGDQSDFIDWAGLYQLLLDLRQESLQLKEIEICN